MRNSLNYFCLGEVIKEGRRLKGFLSRSLGDA